VVPDSQVPAQSQHWQASALTTAGEPSMSQPHVLHPSVAQSTHGQHPAAHDTLHATPAAQVPAQSQHWQASVLPTVGVHSTFQPYAMAPTVTVPVCGQLKVVHLAQADHHFLDQLQAVADKPPFFSDLSLRNEWCIAPEVSKGCFMQSWFLAVKIESFSGVEGSLLDNPELLWRRVPNDALFLAIRSA
jgi:hypothetical protein